MSEARTLISHVKGERIDKFLAWTQKDLSRSQIYIMMNNGLVTVDGNVVKPSYRLKQGELVELKVIYSGSHNLIPQNIPVDVVYEDADLLVVNKPAGMVVHPGPGHNIDTLANAILGRMPDILGVGKSFRPGIVHRLDKNTSGLMVIAKTPTAHENVAKQIKDRKVLKVYLTLVCGTIDIQEGIIRANIGRDPKNRKRMAVVETGKYSESWYKVIEKYDKHTLLEVTLKTGRTHQIRVHFSSIGHPIFGDLQYGIKDSTVNRHFLHSSKLGFRLPSTGAYIEFESDIPYDLDNVLNRIRKNI